MIEGGLPDELMQADGASGKGKRKRGRPAGKKQKRDDGEPKAKKPLTSYLLFAQEFRKTLGEQAPQEKMKLIGARWRELTDTEKQSWKAQAEALAAKAKDGAPAETEEDEPEVDDAPPAVAPEAAEPIADEAKKKKKKKKEK